MKSTSTTTILGALSAAALALLVVSGIPAFKDAASGWKHVVGDLAWGGFLVAAAGLAAYAVTVIVRRRRAAV
jgi:hypothetical protein